MLTTGDYRGADADALRLLARTLDSAADSVAASSRSVRAAAGDVCVDVAALTPLANVVWSLRDHALDVRRAVAAMEGYCLADPPGVVSFEIPAPEEPESGGWGHTLLDVAGFVPVVGAIPDGVNALWYAAEGDGVNAGLSAMALVPLFGDGAAAVKFVGKNADEVAAALRSGDEVFNTADLFANEAKGAHVLRKHVGKSVDELAERIARDGTEIASSFFDEASAVRGIDAALRENPDRVLAVLRGEAAQQRLVARVSGVGRVVLKDGSVLDATHVRVILRHHDDGAVVVTAMLEAL